MFGNNKVNHLLNSKVEQTNHLDSDSENCIKFTAKESSMIMINLIMHISPLSAMIL